MGIMRFGNHKYHQLLSDSGAGFLKWPHSFWMKHHCQIHPGSPRTSLLAIQPFMLASSMIFNPTAFMRLIVIRGKFPQWPKWMLMDMEYTKLTPPKLPLVRYHWSHKDSIPKKNQFYIYIIRSSFEVGHFHGVESKRYMKNWWTFRKKSGDSWWCYCPSCCLVMSWWLPWRGFLRRVLPPKWRRSWSLEPFFFLAGRTWSDGKKETLDTKNEMILNVCHFGYICPIFFAIMLKSGRISITDPA